MIDCIREAVNGYGHRSTVARAFSMHKKLGSVLSTEVHVDMKVKIEMKMEIKKQIVERNKD